MIDIWKELQKKAIGTIGQITMGPQGNAESRLGEDFANIF